MNAGFSPPKSAKLQLMWCWGYLSLTRSLTRQRSHTGRERAQVRHHDGDARALARHVSIPLRSDPRPVIFPLGSENKGKASVSTIVRHRLRIVRPSHRAALGHF
jgi:hypothetical protein